MKKKFAPRYTAQRSEGKEITPAAWDTETLGLGGELACITLSTPGKEPVYFDGNGMLEAFINTLMLSPTGFYSTKKNSEGTYPKKERGAVVYYAHNAQYDFRYLLNFLAEQKFIVNFSMRTDSDIYSLVFSRSTEEGSPFVELRDSFALYPASLEKFAEQFAPPEFQKLVSAINHDAGEIFDTENPTHVEYAIRDAVALRLSLEKFFSAIHELFGVHPGATTAGTAIRAWQHTLPAGRQIFNSAPQQEEFFRRGYFGGLVFLTSVLEHKNAECYDINSSYPAHMRKVGAPAGRPMATKTYFPSSYCPGMYECDFVAPEGLVIPILPHRDAKGSIKWASGKFRSVATNLEIDFAVEHGYKVEKIHRGYIWNEFENLFEEFVNICEGLRKKYKGTAFEIVAKLIQNACYGKFATSRERRVITREERGVPIEGIRDPETGNPMFFVDKQVSSQDDMIVKVEYAAFITAAARITLLKNAYACGPENVLYGDTDSLTVKAGCGKSLDVGSAYGQFKLEKVWSRFRATAPKVYAGEYAAEYAKPGKGFGGAAKGLSKRSMGQAQYEALLKGEHIEVEYRSLDKLIKVMRSGQIREAQVLKRGVSDLERSAHYELREDGSVRPKVAG